MPGVRQDLRRALHAVAFAQAGYFTAAQAKTVGYSYQAQKYHVDHGNWMRVDRGLFRLPEWPSSPEDVYARWVTWSGGRAVISHDSALAVHGLSDLNPAKIHLTVPKGFRAKDDAVVTHTAALTVDDIEQRGSFPVTTVERTLFDVAASPQSQEIVDQAVADAVRMELTTVRRLRHRAMDTEAQAALGIERALGAMERGE